MGKRLTLLFEVSHGRGRLINVPGRGSVLLAVVTSVAAEIGGDHSTFDAVLFRERRDCPVEKRLEFEKVLFGRLRKLGSTLECGSLRRLSSVSVVGAWGQGTIVKLQRFRQLCRQRS
jgi:hypothetical protein